MSIKDDYQEYKNALNELKINSKPLINVLTMLAEEKIYNAPQIVRAIEERIFETKGDAVLHVLYVLDSIVKNLRSPIYVQLFEQKLPVLFATAFNKVDERTRSAMFKLRQTWTPFFSNASLHNLDTRTNYIDPAWPITARVVTNSSTEETKTRDDNYQMIPIERARVDHDHSEKVVDTNQIKKDEKEFPNNESFSENLFGGSDIDYRENNANATTDSDSIYELNNKCFSLAEEKYRSKELSTEQYQATLKLLQEILENEARRLTANTTTKDTPMSVVINSTYSFRSVRPK